MRKAAKRPNATIEELLQDLLIVQLGLAGLPQTTIRDIVGVDMNRVNKIVKHFKKSGK